MLKRTAAAGTLAAALAAATTGCTISEGPLIPPRPVPDSTANGVAMNVASPPPQPVRRRSVVAAQRRPAPAVTRRQTAPGISTAPVERSRIAAATPPPTPARTAPAQPKRPARNRAPAQIASVEKPARARSFPAETERATSPARSEEKPGSIRFTAVVGAPQSAIEPLSRQLEASAKHQGIVIRNDPKKPVDDVLRGYFSASKSGRRTTVDFVWDVLDADGKRLHRIQGSEVVKSRPGDGDAWASVPAATMREIAKQTLEAYKLWHAAKALHG